MSALIIIAKGPPPRDGALVQAEADRLLPRLKRAFINAILATIKETSPVRIRRALDYGSRADALNEIPFADVTDPMLRSGFVAEARNITESSAAITVAGIAPPAAPPTPGAPGGSGGRRPPLHYEIADDRALRFIQNYGANLVTQVSGESRLAVRRTLAEMTQRGWDTRTTATEVMRHIGLTERLALSLVNFREGLIDQGIEGALLERRLNTKANQLLRYRATVIARTESALASAVGQDLAWLQAIDRGYLDPNVALVVWHTAKDEKVCPRCGPMDGQLRRIGEPFITGGGGRALVPTDVHPACRCIRGLRPYGTRQFGGLQLAA